MNRLGESTLLPRTLFAVLTLAAAVATALTAQQTIRLYPAQAPGSEEWQHDRKQYHSAIWATEVVTNVVDPTLSVFRPEASTANGTAVVIAPGGGFHALSIDSEGNDVARWLTDRGVTSFVLEYRLVPTGEDGVVEMMQKSQEEVRRDFQKVVPLAVADGQAAVRWVRSRAAAFDVDPQRIGLMGFSAGGAVAAGVLFADEPTSRPDFVAPIYLGLREYIEAELPSAAPPAFILAATDDQLGLAKDSVALYSKWLAAGKTAELHLYSKGGHGFGMRRQDLPSDRWITLFAEWLEVHGFLPSVTE